MVLVMGILYPFVAQRLEFSELSVVLRPAPPLFMPYMNVTVCDEEANTVCIPGFLLFSMVLCSTVDTQQMFVI